MPARMRNRSHFNHFSRPSLAWTLLCVHLIVLLFAGGASRGDVLGQAIVRGVSGILLVVAILFGTRPAPGQARPVILLLAAAIMLPVLQLIPLPPSVWTMLPGRAILEEAASASGQMQPWRPWSIVPTATANAAASLIVPVTIMLLAMSIRAEEQRRLIGLLLILALVSALSGLLQFSGLAFTNPLVNATPGTVSGLFANRNHFGLFLALGCLLVPVWVFPVGGRPRWRAPIGLGLLLVFLLTVLASGSRAGMGLGILALVLGVSLCRRSIANELSHYTRRASLGLLGGIAGVIVTAILLSVAAGRAISIERVFTLDPGQDVRARGLPIIWAMIKEYFPVGSGLGGFDPVFRLHEPFALLKPTYFNRAHNDFLEIVLDAGLLGLLLLVAGLLWWGLASVRAWRVFPASGDRLPALGSATLLLIILASIPDYPARTPMIMGMMVIAALWLSGRSGERSRSALPRSGQHLKPRVSPHDHGNT